MGTLLPSIAKQRSRADPTCALALTLFGARALCFAKDCFFACQRAPTLAQTIRAYDWWETGAPRARARSRTRFARVICGKFSPRAFIGQEPFRNFVKRYMTISQSRAPFERGSKLVRKTVLTDSRFPGTELLSTASVELKGVPPRANLEEQVRIKEMLIN